MRVDVWSDIVCPWCYLGQARFERALTEFEHRDQVEVVHRSFELDPSFPKGEVVSVLDMLSRKYGLSRDKAAEAEANMAQMAAAEGLEFSVDRPHGNTFDAHRLLHLARDRGRQDEMLTRLFGARRYRRPVLRHRRCAGHLGRSARRGLPAGPASGMGRRQLGHSPTWTRRSVTATASSTRDEQEVFLYNRVRYDSTVFTLMWSVLAICWFVRPS
jgi:hypothetical protein